ncbi:MAG TPA: ATP-binding protein [Actinomycetota bacterium]|nr:ATP-binding protein [Actinomycetota bacterium]
MKQTLSSAYVDRLKRPPAELLERVRWLFVLGTLGWALTLLPLVAIAEANAILRIVGCAALVLIPLRRAGEYLRRAPGSITGDLYEGIGLVALGLSLGTPAATGRILIMGLIFRAFYPSIARLSIMGAIYGAGYLGSIVVSVGLNNALTPTYLFPLAGLWVLAGLMYLVMRGMLDQANAVRREQLLRNSMIGLMAAPDRRSIAQAATASIEALTDRFAGSAVAVGTPVSMQIEAASWLGPDQVGPPVVTADLPLAAAVGNEAIALEGADAVRLQNAFGFAHTTEHALFVPLRTHRDVKGALVVATEHGPAEYEGLIQSLALTLTLSLESFELAEKLHAKNSEARFLSLVQNSSDVILIVGEDSTVRYETPSAQRTFGGEADERIGQRLATMVHPDDLANLLGAIGGSLDTTASASLDCRWTKSDGSEVFTETSVSNLLSDPNVKGFVLNIRDISERQTLEEQLRHSQKMEAVGRLAGGIAHDFNNILSVIQNYATFLKEDLEGEDERQADAQEIVAASERAAALVRQLLTFSRKDLTRPEILEVNSVVTGVEKMLRRTIGENIDLQLELTENLPPVEADPGHLEQILMNLAVNAKDAMKAGGSLKIETSCAVSDENPDSPTDTYVLIEVTDTGTGIDPKHSSAIFEPFFTTKAAGEGTGLGLATVYGIARKNGGEVFFSSELGAGTTFYVLLPVTDKTTGGDAPAEPAGGVAHAGGQTVLVVEDESAVLNIVDRMLTRAGYVVVGAGSGVEALHKSSDPRTRIDLLLTDMVLPEMNGIEISRYVQELRPGIPTIYMSGYPGETLSEQGELPEGAAFIAKPFSADELIDTVRDALAAGGHGDLAREISDLIAS